MNTGDWNKNLRMSDFYKIQLEGYKEWDKTDNNKPYFIEFSIVKGRNKSSRDIAVEFDDIAKGYFYYRDWTNSGLPFVDEGEVYNSGFCFQLKEDKEVFVKMFI